MPPGRLYTQWHDNALCQVLIHGNGAAHKARSRIFDTQQVKGRLHLTVLAALPVQRHKHQIGRLTQFKDPVAELAFTSEFS